MKGTLRDSLLAGLFMVLWSLVAGAQEYIELSPPRPTDDPSKVEVIEFFWYGCPHCYRFDPYLEEWLKNKPANVTFRRQPAIFGPHWEPHARAYYTAEVLGVLDKIHKDLFDVMHKERKRMTSEEEMADFFAAHGVDKQTFNNTFHSFSVEMKVRQAESIPASYGITGVPAVVVNGKYLISGTTTKGFDNMIKVMDDRVKHELNGQSTATR